VPGDSDQGESEIDILAEIAEDMKNL
jgi:hypothetical protein